MVNHNIAQQAKQQSIVHVERTCHILSCSIVSCQIKQEGGNLPSWSKKQRGFSLRFLSIALSISFNWFSMKEPHFAEKLPTSLISHTYTSNKYQPFRLANLNKGYLYVTPIGDSLRMRLVPVPDMQNNALNFECLRN